MSPLYKAFIVGPKLVDAEVAPESLHIGADIVLNSSQVGGEVASDSLLAGAALGLK